MAISPSSYSHSRALTGKVAIVTGAGRGVGRGIATALAGRGATVLLTDVDETNLKAVETDLKGSGGNVVALVADLRHPTSAQQIVDFAVATFGRIDALLNNAIAIKPPTPFLDQTDDDFRLTFDTGPRATFALMKAAHPHMCDAGGGSIVNLGSGAGTKGDAMFGVYAGAKEAIRGISKVAAVEWGADRIRVNVICPFANSEGALAWEQFDPKAFHAAMEEIPMKRIGDTVADVGALVCFLVGDDSTYITAQTILIDGGGGSFR